MRPSTPDPDWRGEHLIRGIPKIPHGGGTYRLPKPASKARIAREPPKPAQWRIVKPASTPYYQGIRERVCAMLNDGLSPAEIERRLALSRNAVYGHQREMRRVE